MRRGVLGGMDINLAFVHHLVLLPIAMTYTTPMNMGRIGKAQRGILALAQPIGFFDWI